METKSIMIVGVGGQGTLLASRILGGALIDMGHDVKVSEVHGMSQRGGSVVTYVRYGTKVYSPIIDKGGADLILAFELLEAQRVLPFLKKGGKIIVNSQQMAPMPVITGQCEYPPHLADKLKTAADATIVNALALAKEAGNIKAVNVVLIGVMAKNSEIPLRLWLEAIKKTVPEKFLDINIKAFNLGYEI